jgi:5-formyltetrahydrofolate cyclo-ligase
MASSAGDLDDRKAALRREMRDRRKALSAQARAAAATAACGRLQALPEWSAAAVIAGYAALPSELDPAAALGAARARGATVALPRVDDRRAPRLRFHLVAGPEDLAPGAFGIHEPREGCPEVDPGRLDVLLLPGLAFDEAGGRLGYGKGYYDELVGPLRAAGGPFSVGFGFDFQIVGRCPVGPGDIPIDCVVTETRVVRPRRALHTNEGT